MSPIFWNLQYLKHSIMENKMYNQPAAYNNEYNSGHPSGEGYPEQPPPYYQPYPAQGYPTGYYNSSVAPASAPPPVVFVNNENEPRSPENANNMEANNFGASFSDKNIRKVFVRKVYSILFVQLLFTFGIVALFVFQNDVKYYVQRNMGVYYASYAVFFVTYLTLACCPAVRRRYPTNIICLIIFTLALSYMTGTISSFYDTTSVFIAAGICAGVCLGITLLSLWSKFDITGYGIYLAVASWVIFFFGIFAIATFHWIPIIKTVYYSIAALLMMLFLAYDTQIIIGGKRHEISPEEHIIGALSLYLDIVYIFILILGLFGGKK